MALTGIGPRWAARFVMGAVVCSSSVLLAGHPTPCVTGCLPSDASTPPAYHTPYVDPNCPPAPVEPAPVPTDDGTPPAPMPSDDNASPMPNDLPPALDDNNINQQVDDVFNNNIQAPAAPNLAQFQQTTSTTGNQNAFGTPNMIGDFFGSSAYSSFDFTGLGPMMTLTLPGGNIAAAPGQNVGRMKITENTNPFPQDRAYINYSYFHNTPLAAGGVNVNRVTPGFEKTFLDGNMSFELRTPFATTLNSTVDISSPVSDTDNAEFGNMTMYLKALLWRDSTWAFSGGLGMAVPTADNFEIVDNTNNFAVYVENESVHLLPFFGSAYTPNDRLFVNTFLQFDFDANGNSVYGTDQTDSFVKLGNGNDRSYVFLDLSLGYWIYRNRSSSGITGIAPIFEYHLNQSLDNGDRIAGNAGTNSYDFGRPGGISVSNAVLGLTTEFHNNANLTLAYATPIDNSDRQFDGELRVMFNWAFGGGCFR